MVYIGGMEVWTIQKLLGWMVEYFGAKGVDSPRFSAELLLAHVLKWKRIELYTHFDAAVGPNGWRSCADWSSEPASTSRSRIWWGRRSFIR